MVIGAGVIGGVIAVFGGWGGTGVVGAVGGGVWSGVGGWVGAVVFV